MEDRDRLVWCAGFFDGEGCIQIGNQKRLDVTISQRVRKPLDLVAEVLGSRVYGPYASQGGQYIWTSNGKAAGLILISLRPYLVIKGEQADLAVRWLEAEGPERLELAKQIKALKRPWLSNAKEGR